MHPVTAIIVTLAVVACVYTYFGGLTDHFRKDSAKRPAASSFLSRLIAPLFAIPGFILARLMVMVGLVAELDDYWFAKPEQYRGGWELIFASIIMIAVGMALFLGWIAAGYITYAKSRQMHSRTIDWRLLLPGLVLWFVWGLIFGLAQDYQG